MAGLLLIGAGGVGGHVLANLTAAEHARGVAVLVRTPRDLPKGAVAVSDLSNLPFVPDLAVECAGHAAVSQWGPAVLEKGVDLLVTSIGALTHTDVMAKLEAAAKRGGAKILLSAGAIAGVDALAAARQGGLTSVRYTSRKPPRGWKGTPAEQVVDLDSLKEPAVLFEGPADKAAQLYPQNANVAATVAFAGLGFAGTQVRLMADPSAPGNVHLIEAEGAFGEMRIEIKGKPLPSNPKTSTLTALSVLRVIRNRSASIEI